MSASPRRLRSALLRWYDRNGRELPWRRSRDPYAIWVSEIMLQQTRVDTVLRYYDRFVERFPTPRALAEASEDEVLSAWSGLGYYRRARLLHSGVREVVARYGGVVPEAAEARRALPGVGRYTAGAIGSIAFGLSEALVDGNVARVLSRLYGIDTPPGRADTERALWRHAEWLVPGPRPGDFNQALMELGATVCRKANPDCPRCPLRAGCVAEREGRVAELPVVRARKPPVPTTLHALLVVSGRGAGRRVWLQRGEGALFGGLWNLPSLSQGEPAALRAHLRALGLGGGTIPERPAGELEHVLSHRRLQVTLWCVRGARSLARAGLQPFAPAQLAELGISSLTRRLLVLGGLLEGTGPSSSIAPHGGSK